jgi:hypothetical protein
MVIIPTKRQFCDTCRTLAFHEAEDHSRAVKRWKLIDGIFLVKIGNPENIAFY